MLSIGKLGKGQERYYLDKVAEGAEDYYTGEGEDPGEWIGDAAARLGLEGEVGADQLEAMLTGRNPVDGVSQAGFDGDPETRIPTWKKGTPKPCHDRRSTPMSCSIAVPGWSPSPGAPSPT